VSEALDPRTVSISGPIITPDEIALLKRLHEVKRRAACVVITIQVEESGRMSWFVATRREGFSDTPASTD
jgi:hypothetical protein